MSTVRFYLDEETPPEPEYIVHVEKNVSAEFKSILNEIFAIHQQGVKLDYIFKRLFPTLPLNPARSNVQEFKENSLLQKRIIYEFLKSNEIYFENYFNIYFLCPLLTKKFPNPEQFNIIAEEEFFKVSREKSTLEDAFKKLFHPLTLNSSSCEVIKQLSEERDEARRALLISFLNSNDKSLQEYFIKHLFDIIKKTTDTHFLDYYKKGISTQSAVNYFFRDSRINLKSDPKAIKEFYNNPANLELLSPSQNAFLKLFMLKGNSTQSVEDFFKTYYRSYLKREKKKIVSHVDIIKDLRAVVNESTLPIHVAYEKKLRPKVTIPVEYSSLLTSHERKEAKMSFRRSSVRKFFDKEVTDDLRNLVKKQICNELVLGASPNVLFTIYFAQYKALSKRQINDLLIKRTKLPPLVRNVLRLFLISHDASLKDFFMDLVSKNRELHVAWKKIAEDLIDVQISNKIEKDQIYTNLLGDFAKEMTHKEVIELLLTPEKECKLSNDHRIFLTVFARSNHKTLGDFFEDCYITAPNERLVDEIIMAKIKDNQDYQTIYRDLVGEHKPEMTRAEAGIYLKKITLITLPYEPTILDHFSRSNESNLGSYFNHRYENVQFDYMLYDHIYHQAEFRDLHLALLPEVSLDMTINKVKEYLDENRELLYSKSLLYLNLFLQSGYDTIGAFLYARYESVIIKYSFELSELFKDKNEAFFCYQESSDEAFASMQSSKLRRTATKADIIKLYSTHNTGVKTLQVHAILQSFLSSGSCTLGEFFDTNCSPLEALELTRSPGMSLGLR